LFLSSVYFRLNKRLSYPIHKDTFIMHQLMHDLLTAGA
jgi:hypothetical protein